MTILDIVKLEPKLIQHIEESICKALKVYAHFEIVPKPYYFTNRIYDKEITVVGMLDFKEIKNRCIVSLGFSNDVFLKIYEKMFHEKLTEISLESADLAGELINIIFQSISPELRKLGYNCEASLPKVFTKSNLHEWINLSVEQSLVLPFSAEGGNILFEIFEMKGDNAC